MSQQKNNKKEIIYTIYRSIVHYKLADGTEKSCVCKKKVRLSNNSVGQPKKTLTKLIELIKKYDIVDELFIQLQKLDQNEDHSS